METIYYLRIQSGPESGKEFSLDKPELFLGRDPNNDIVIPDAEVSRRHARFVLSGAQYAVEDLGSTNGTSIRGIRVQGITPLTSGDTLSIGERVVLLYESIVTDPNATIAVPRHIGYRPEALSVEPKKELPQATAEPVRSALDQIPQPAAPQLVMPEAEMTAEPPFSGVDQKKEPATDLEETILPEESSYAGKTPDQPQTPKKKKTWRGILLIVVLLILIFCVIPWIIIDITSSYCLFVPGILNAIQPGVCP